MHRRLAWPLGAFALLALLQSIPFVWYSPAIKARVVTASGAPAAGAVVVASWNIEGSLNGATQGQLALVEVVTGPDGWFQIPAWGPRFVWRGTVFEDEPTVRIFHPDFAPLVLRNSEVGMRAAPRILTFRYQDQTLTLKDWPATAAGRATALDELLRSMSRIRSMPPLDRQCYPQIIPRLLALMLKTKHQLPPQGGNASLEEIETFAAPDPLMRQSCH